MWIRKPMRKVSRRSACRQRGLAAIEFAIVLPLILLLMLATAEVARAFYQYNTLSKAARDGIRYLADTALNGTTGLIDLDAEDGNSGQTKRERTQNLVVYGNLSGTGTPLLEGLAVDDVVISAVGLDHVRVDASYTYIPMLPVIPTFGYTGNDIGTNFTLQASTSMRAL